MPGRARVHPCRNRFESFWASAPEGIFYQPIGDFRGRNRLTAAAKPGVAVSSTARLNRCPSLDSLFPNFLGSVKASGAAKIVHLNNLIWTSLAELSPGLRPISANLSRVFFFKLPQNRHPERSASQMDRVIQRLWRGVEEPVLSVAEGTSAVRNYPCCYELFNH